MSALTAAEARELYALWLAHGMRPPEIHETHPAYTGPMKLGRAQPHPEDDDPGRAVPLPARSQAVETLARRSWERRNPGRDWERTDEAETNPCRDIAAADLAAAFPATPLPEPSGDSGGGEANRGEKCTCDGGNVEDAPSCEVHGVTLETPEEKMLRLEADVVHLEGLVREVRGVRGPGGWTPTHPTKETYTREQLLSDGADALARLDYALFAEEMGIETVWEERSQGQRNVYLDAARERIETACDALDKGKGGEDE